MAELRLMDVVERDDKWWIVQKGWRDHGPFDTQREAHSWADKNIDDQVYGDPNSFVEELRTRG